MEHIRSQRTILFSAAYEGELELFKRCASDLDRVLGVGLPAILGNFKDGDGRRALHYAAKGGKQDVLQYLIEEIKLDVDVQDNSGETPLCRAAIEGRASIVAYLMRMGANPEIPTDTNMYPLHHAAKEGHNGVIIFLHSFKNDINIDVSNDFGSPLQFACAYGQHETVKMLLQRYNANPNLLFNEVTTSLQASIRSKSWQCVEHLLKAGADPNGGPDGVKALPLAAEIGVVKIIKLLVEAGADPNVTNLYGLKPLEEAARHGNHRGVEILFPVTSPIPSYVDWSIDGVMKHANSGDFTMISKEEIFLEAKSRGTSAFQSKKYWLAVYWYTEALEIDPSDAAVLSNRSLCYVYLNNGEFALEDAEQCLATRPKWSKAHYRKGAALELLNRLDDAAKAFSDGLKVDPENRELEAAFRNVSLARKKSVSADKSA